MRLGLILFVLYGLSLVGCSDDDDIGSNVERERNLFIGKWDVIENYKQFRSDTLHLDINREFTLDILENGSAYEENLLGMNLDTLEWYYQFNPKQIVFIKPISGIISNAISYDVSIVNEGRMTWESKYSLPQVGGELIKVEVSRGLNKR